MNIVVIYGTHKKEKSCTYNIAQKFKENLLKDGDNLEEFVLPKDMPNFCNGCMRCFLEESTKCKDYKYLEPIYEAIEKSDLIIFTAPVYVFHVPGQVKAFLDHFGHQWLVHRPKKENFKKSALIISTAAGGGTKSTMKDIQHSMNFWGIGQVYTLGINVYSMDWQSIKEEKKEKIFSRINRISSRIERNLIKNPTSLKTKLRFDLYRQIHKRVEFSESDSKHWKSHGWLEKKRPWRE